MGAACNNLHSFDAWAERGKSGRENRFSLIPTSSPVQRILALRSVKHPVSLIRHEAFNSCLLCMYREQDHLEVDDKLGYKFKTIRLEALAPQNLPCH